MLLSRRFNTGWNDGMYCQPGGHLEGKEPILDALIREAREEAGLELEKKHLEVVHVMHRKTIDREYIDFIVQAKRWDGEPRNTEPHKCDDLSWFPLDALPDNLLDAARHTLELYQKGVFFSEFGWNNAAV